MTPFRKALRDTVLWLVGFVLLILFLTTKTAHRWMETIDRIGERPQATGVR